MVAVGDIGSWPRAFAAAALGLAAIVLVAQIRFVGPLLRVLIVLLGAGALTLAMWHGLRSGRRQRPRPAA